MEDPQHDQNPSGAWLPHGGASLLDSAVVDEMDAAHAALNRAHLRMFAFVARADRAELWREWGAHDMAHWLSIRYGMSWWQARRWVRAAHAMGSLFELPAAFSRGELGLEKVLELCRFVTPETELELVEWALGASRTAVRRRADRESRRTREHAVEAEQSRSVNWWYFDDGRRFGMQADLPAADGAVVAKALDRLAAEIPRMPDEEDDYFLEARRADALVAMASARIASDADPDRATVVIHARAEDLVRPRRPDAGSTPPPAGEDVAPRRDRLPATGHRPERVTTSGETGRMAEGAVNRRTDGEPAAWPASSEIDGGPVIGVDTARRLACTARTQIVEENAAGDPVRLGRLSREPSEWMMRQLRHRDGGCTFPGCGVRRFAHAHHIEWWSAGGRTDLGNLALVCAFHHKLVHEYGWRIERRADGSIAWFRPDGSRYRPAPRMPEGTPQDALAMPP